MPGEKYPKLGTKTGSKSYTQTYNLKQINDIYKGLSDLAEDVTTKEEAEETMLFFLGVGLIIANPLVGFVCTTMVGKGLAETKKISRSIRDAKIMLHERVIPLLSSDKYNLAKIEVEVDLITVWTAAGERQYVEIPTAMHVVALHLTTGGWKY